MQGIKQLLEVCRKGSQALKELQDYTFALHDKVVELHNQVIALELHAQHQDQVRASAPSDGGAGRPKTWFEQMDDRAKEKKS